MSAEFKAVSTPETDPHEKAIKRVAEAVHRMNEAIQKAVDSGISVELVRVSRHHDGAGNWGDQMIPLVREPAAAK